MSQGLTLLIPEKFDEERAAVAAAWERDGGVVLPLSRFWQPPALDPERVRIYGSGAFCLVLQQILNLDLLSPPDDLILSVPAAQVKRSLGVHALSAIPALAYPIFVKPLLPKLFRAQVHDSSETLLAECAGLPPEIGVLVSEVVNFTAEARCFVLDGRVLDCSVYEGTASRADALAFAREVAERLPDPCTYVLDVGWTTDRGWAVVEFNATWGAGLNGCDPNFVLPAIEAATRARSRPCNKLVERRQPEPSPRAEGRLLIDVFDDFFRQ